MQSPRAAESGARAGKEVERARPNGAGVRCHMQRLTYINLLNESVIFTGEAPYVLCKAEGVGPPELDFAEMRGAYQHGATLTGFRRVKREVDVTLHIHGGTRAEMYAHRLRLSGALSPERAMDGARRARILYENDHGRWWTWAVPAGDVSWGGRVGNFMNAAKVRFVCESPYWYGMTQSSLRFEYGGSALRLPFRLPFKLGRRNFSATASGGGQTDAPVEIWIYGTGETPSLRNHTTGAALRLTSPLPNGSVLYINTDPAHLEATITDAGGAAGNAFGLVDVAHPVSRFTLRAGLNELEYEPGGDSVNTVIELKWYSRYEGV